MSYCYYEDEFNAQKEQMYERKEVKQAHTHPARDRVSVCVRVCVSECQKIRPRNDKLVVNWCSIILHGINTTRSLNKC